MTTNESQPRKKLNLEVNEEILWHSIRRKGIFRKKTVEVLIITNHRVMKELPQSGHLFTLLLTQIDKVQVLNQYRDSNMGITGVGVRSGNIRSKQYHGRSRSKNVGDILFISKDFQDFNFVGIQDPKSLADMVKAAKDVMEQDHE